MRKQVWSCLASFFENCCSQPFWRSMEEEWRRLIYFQNILSREGLWLYRRFIYLRKKKKFIGWNEDASINVNWCYVINENGNQKGEAKIKACCLVGDMPLLIKNKKGVFCRCNVKLLIIVLKYKFILIQTLQRAWKTEKHLPSCCINGEFAENQSIFA